MAEMSYDDFAETEAPAVGASAVSVAVSWFGAILSVGLVVGMGVWGWRLAVRDVSEVPVVRALEGPMRIQPDDPGGVAADYQGLAVNRIPEAGEVSPPPDQIVLAPPPVDLDPVEDRPAGALPGAALSPSPNVVAEAPVAPTAPAADPAETAQGDVAASASDTDRAVAEALRLADVAAESASPLALNGAEAAGAPAPSTDSLPVTGIRTAPRPVLRPATAPVIAAADAGIDVDPDSLPAGTRLAQIGAYDSRDEAVLAWDRLARRFSLYLVDKKRLIQKTRRGGRDFYRLRVVGFAGLDDSRRFCSALRAEKVECIPVAHR